MAEFKHLEIDRKNGIIKIDGEQLPKNATELNLHISGTDCRLEITLEYSGARRKWKSNGISEENFKEA